MNEIVVFSSKKKDHQNINASTFRGSQYRGVSKNKNKWQVTLFISYGILQMMIMGYFKKIYVGALEDEKEAALLYDKIALLIHGIKVYQIL